MSDDDGLLAEALGGTSRHGGNRCICLSVKGVAGCPIHNPIPTQRQTASKHIFVYIDEDPDVCVVCGMPQHDSIHVPIEEKLKNMTVVDDAKNAAAKVLQQPVVYMEATGERSVNYEFLNIPTEQATVIVRDILPDILNRFLAKNRDYGEPSPGNDLGPKAEFVRLWNKVLKLRRALWEDEALEFEQVDEIIDDLVGHLLLARFGLSG
ncbi:hypothetical protein SEA_AIKOY__81 [Mycobacterium phage Aikoy]|uniref:Uncharacterized protein n=1 Tax=Mycobacterium phage Onyinye TaxID=2686235 RepID=A0A6B9LFD0_9CAUD|nr:hypothetical protein PP339_gp081 [Mycobacterium phage Onyinye]QHB37485.1 hypothetical protein SEA_ONYINYE_81 [Mycobacterium phage Onyinye]WKW85243.1 hypothetical protein SEA_AIKOY__81 [Mycobacterium phage Aikoy]